MRKLGIALAIVLAVIVIAVAALPYLLDVNSYRDRIQTELQKRTGRAVSLGNMELKVFPFAFIVQNAVIGEDPAFKSTAPFAQISEMLVAVKLAPLLQKKVEIDSLTLKDPKIELIRNAQGKWNFSSLGNSQPTAQPQQPAAKTPQPTPQPQPQEKQAFELGRLDITNGQVAVTDFQKKQPRAVYDHIDLTLNGYAPGKPVDFDLTAHLPGAGAQQLSLSGKGGPLQDNVLATNFDGTLKLDGVSLSGLKKFVNSEALADMEFNATGSTDVKNKGGVVSADGKITLDHIRVKRANLTYPINADFNVVDDLNTDVLTLNKGDLKLGNTPVSVKGSVNASATPSQLDLRALVKNASIADAARLAGAFGVAFNPGMQVNGTVDADMTIRGTSSSPIMNGTASARNLDISGGKIQQPVKVSEVNLQLTPTLVKSNEFVASTGSTKVNVAFALNDYSGPRSSVDATIKAPGAQLGELISIGQAYGVDALDGMSGSGAVSIDLHVNGSTKNPAGMQYSGNGSLNNASIGLPSLTEPVKVQHADLKFSQNAAILQNAVFSLGSTHATGQFTIRNMAAPAPEAQFALNADVFNADEWKGMVRNQPVQQKTFEGFSLVPSAHAAEPAQPNLMDRLTGGGNVTVGKVVYDDLELTNAKATATFDHGLIRLSPVTANLYGGVQTGTVVIDTRPTPSTYTVDTKLSGVDANKLLSSVSSLKQALFGVLAANANTHFLGTTQKGDSADVAKTLNGNLSINLQNGRLAGIDLLNQLATIGKFLNYTDKAQPFTNIAKLTGNFVVRNGLAHTDDLTAMIDGGTLGAKGDVNLATQTVDMAVTAVLSQAMAQKVGGTNVGGYLTTALANSKGELVMPVLITGSLQSPKVVPDLKTIAQMKLNNLLPTAGNASSITNILGAITGKKDQQQPPAANGQQPQGQQPQPAQQQKPNAVQSILDALGGKKPAQRPPAQPQPPAQQNPPPQEDKLPDPSNPKL